MTNAHNIAIACSRCGGLGQIGAFQHIAGGVCFDCEGSGVDHWIARSSFDRTNVKLRQRVASWEDAYRMRADYGWSCMHQDRDLTPTEEAAAALDEAIGMIHLSNGSASIYQMLPSPGDNAAEYRWTVRRAGGCAHYTTLGAALSA